MRATLTIDDDVLAAARNLARERSESLGRVMSDLARRGLSAAPRVVKKGKRGFPVFKVSHGARPIALEDVRRLEDEV